MVGKTETVYNSPHGLTPPGSRPTLLAHCRRVGGGEASTRPVPGRYEESIQSLFGDFRETLRKVVMMYRAAGQRGMEPSGVRD